MRREGRGGTLIHLSKTEDCLCVIGAMRVGGQSGLFSKREIEEEFQKFIKKVKGYLKRRAGKDKCGRESS